ncbi:hypothetical protein NQ315_008128 [Exocentrus adspersus]|uniref:TraB domain-containing protein n=1 Tax=Exocentrus adspersus TaxID=1586481 RepID=A0AAV8VXQ7_9CUCU|nr:hypothetical protein NQ315_008128 [Exocentrus adspersus]
MDNSLTNFELTESTVKIGTDSENGSEKSEAIEILGYGDVESSSSNKSDDDFDNNLPDTVTLLKHEKTGAKVYLIGTAHFSKESQDDVVKANEFYYYFYSVITNVLPHVVVIELCSSRTNILSLDEATILEEAKNIDMQKMISTMRSNGVYNGLMYLLLLNMSAHLTKEIGMAPGGEFRVAYREALKIPNCTVHLGDRPINVTLKRALAKLTWFQTIKLAWHLLTNKEPVSVEDIEKCKNRDMLEQLLADLAGEYPAFREVFLDERDIYLTNSLQMAALSKWKPDGHEGAGEASQSESIRVVGVVGMGHVAGITRLWPQEQRPFVKDIITIPPPSVTSRVVKYSFKISLLTFGGYLIYRYVPVPRFLRENVHMIVQKVINNVKTDTGVKYTLH